MTRIAVLSDPHLHDVHAGTTDDTPLVRSFADSMASTRVFNESGPAFRAALDALVAEGITLCIIVGDLTDDGQPASWQAVSDLLADYTRRHGVRFFATPGNHDQWSMTGKPLAKSFVDADGHVEALAGQSIPRRAGARLWPGQRMVGYDEATLYAEAFGYRPQPSDLHWETPFGTTPDLADREARFSSARGDSAFVCDLSYLVEPVEGLWLLSLDANVYLPDGTGGYTDCSKEGWNATVRHKPYLLDWMRDVAQRARKQGKRLVTFSHYPVADVFHGCTEALARLPSSRAGARQMPRSDVAAAIAGTGIPLHFSGHWHVDSTASSPGGEVVNVAIPSTVAFPAGWKCLTLDADGARICDRAVTDAPGFDAWFGRYAAEAERTVREAPALTAADYPDFLDLHFRDVVLNRRLPEDWPKRMQPMVQTARLSDVIARLGHSDVQVPDIAFADVFVDWYRLREAGAGAAAVAPERRALYADLARTCASPASVSGPDTAILAVFFETLGIMKTGNALARAALDRLRSVAETC
ncbi:metallophosphoesterase family protein [Psychromarinibacter halotolerans]|uniref:Metallophosphoesterase family protein n=1 Tax=Psychromarinibacter halotolerans TaxID=1775175 RepID=A0ABV7GVH1_9RHOB|nr:metallophosphoesterase [Psychromarinibacter halotolerans]MDF0598514.1 metallophosphoesterase [Psychromarinibacter halotolerans]